MYYTMLSFWVYVELVGAGCRNELGEKRMICTGYKTLARGVFASTLLITGMASSGPLFGADGTAVAVGLGLGSLIGGVTPNGELEQVYYLGVFDPQDQIPAMMYRVRIRGQASVLSNTKFASGWVKAELIDSLASRVAFDKDKDGKMTLGVKRADDDETGAIQAGRKLVMFGPEGFREAPKDHRLVIVMGASPESFFSAIDQSLGLIAEVTQGLGDPQLSQDILRAMNLVAEDQRRMAAIQRDVLLELVVAK